MLSTLKQLFDSFTAQPAARSASETMHALKLAAAVLLVEVMRADPDVTPAERTSLVAALRRKFALAEDEVAQLVALAEGEAKNLYDYHRFTSVLNEHFTQAQKIGVVEAMWQVAYADANLNAHEIHLISKVAGLLHVTHGEYIAAKMRAKEDAATGSSLTAGLSSQL